MLKTRRLAAAAAGATVLAAAAAPAGAATTWTQVPSGTTAEITAIDYQSDERAWFATADGRILRLSGGAFVEGTGTLPGAPYVDLAFQPGGAVGLAVTSDGRVQRSVNGGATWSTVVLTPTYRSCTSADGTAVTRLSGVFWAGNATAYYVGGGGTHQPIVLRSDEPVATPSDVNRIAPGGGCRVGDMTDAVTDGFALPTAPATLRFVTDDFGEVFTSADALASPASHLAGLTIGAGGVPRLAVDPLNASRLWVTSTNGGLNYAIGASGRTPVRRASDGLPVGDRLYDVAYAGGTVVAAGDGGAILTSVDGTVAHRQPADGALATTPWRAVDLADAGRAMVGGAGGALVRTTNANAVSAPPDGPTPRDPTPGDPTPRDPAPRRPTTRRPSGSGGGAAGTPPNASGRPATATTGGATIAAWKRIALSKGRYVPVRVSARSARRFVIEVRRAKRPRTRVAMARIRLRRPGRKLVKVPLRASVRTGRYRIVVRVYKGRRAIGRRVTVAIVVAR